MSIVRARGSPRLPPPSPKRTLAASASATKAAAAARAHQIPHTYLHAPSVVVRPGFIVVTDVRLQGECFVMRREPLSAKEGIGACKQSDRPGGGSASPTVRGSPDFSALTWPGPGPEMPLRQRLLLIDGVCGGMHGSVARKKCHHDSLCNHGSFVFARVVGPICSLWNQAGGICKAVLETRM